MPPGCRLQLRFRESATPAQGPRGPGRARPPAGAGVSWRAGGALAGRTRVRRGPGDDRHPGGGRPESARASAGGAGGGGGAVWRASASHGVCMVALFAQQLSKTRAHLSGRIGEKRHCFGSAGKGKGGRALENALPCFVLPRRGSTCQEAGAVNTACVTARRGGAGLPGFKGPATGAQSSVSPRRSPVQES